MIDALTLAIFAITGASIGLFTGIAIVQSRIKKKPLQTKKGTYYFVDKDSNDNRDTTT